MSTYRITVMVTTDVEGEYDTDAMNTAVERIRSLVGDDPHSITGSDERKCWVTGIAQDERGYLVFKQEELAHPN
jgi:hypothetical protein